MVIKDIFLLERSKEFQMRNRNDVTINLNLKKAPAIPNTKILGRVLDNCNRGIEGATVKLLTLKLEPIEHTATDSSGRFLFNNTVSTGVYYIIAAAPSYAVSKSYRVIVCNNLISRLIIKLNTEENINSGIIYGFVQDGLGHRLNNAVVKIFKYNCPDKLSAICSTNDDGEYLVYGLDSGKYSIIAEKTGYNFPNIVSFIIKDNEFTNLNLLLYAHSYNSVITGQVLSSKNQKVPYALVGLYSLSTDNSSKLIKVCKCNEDGIFLFENVKPGKYIVRSNKFEQIVDCG